MNRKIHFMIGLVLLNILFAQEQPEQEKTKINTKTKLNYLRAIDVGIQSELLFKNIGFGGNLRIPFSDRIGLQLGYHYHWEENVPLISDPNKTKRLDSHIISFGALGYFKSEFNKKTRGYLNGGLFYGFNGDLQLNRYDASNNQFFGSYIVGGADFNLLPFLALFLEGGASFAVISGEFGQLFFTTKQTKNYKFGAANHLALGVRFHIPTSF